MNGVLLVPSTAAAATTFTAMFRPFLFDVVQKRFQLLQECVDCLDQCQTRLTSQLKAWRWEQHKATIGLPFDDNLNPLQTW